MAERDDVNPEQDAVTWDLGPDKRAALAERVEADPATDNELDEDSRRVVRQMRELCAALREAGPARVSEGFADRVLVRLRAREAPAPVVRFVPRHPARRLSPALLLQAASLVALVFAYGVLLAATRVYHVGPRWTESSKPAAAAQLDLAPEGIRVCPLSPAGVATVAARRSAGRASVSWRHGVVLHAPRASPPWRNLRLPCNFAKS